MKGIIIAGGFGTRLRPLTYRRPKPLTPIANRPFLEYQVALLRAHGIEDIVFATNYMAEKIESHFGDGSRFGVKMRYALEDTPLGTGGAIRNAADLFPGEDVAVFNGDVLTDFDLRAILEFHKRKGAVATLTLAEIPRPNPFGVLTLDADGRVEAWREPSEAEKKALTGAAKVSEGVDLINAGFYVLDADFIAQIPAGTPSSVERDIFPKLLAANAPVYGIAPGGFWMDVGRAEQLMTASNALLDGKVQTSLPPVVIGEGSEIAPDAQINSRTALGQHCRIGAKTQIADSLLFDNVAVGEGVTLRGVIVDEGTVIEDDVVIEARPDGPVPVLAAGSHIGKGTRL